MVERSNAILTITFLFFLLLPFQFALGVSGGVDLAVARVLAIVIGAAFLAERLRKGSWLLPSMGGLFFAGGFIFFAGLSLLWAGEPLWGLRKLLFFLSFLPLGFLFADIFSKDGAIGVGYIGRGFFFGAVASAFFALFQFAAQFIFSLDQTLSFWMSRVAPLFLGEAFSGAVALHPSLLVNIAGKTMLRAAGTFPDPHVAAFYFGMAIPFGLWLGAEAERGKKFFFFFGTGILFLADLCTFSRGGYVGLFSMLVFFGAFACFHLRERMPVRRKKWVVILLAAVIAVVAFVAPVRERLLMTFSLAEGSNSARIVLWGEARDLIGKRLLLGYGLGNYSLQVKPSAEYREPISAHNIYLDIWAELGIVGLVLFLGIFCFPLGIFFFRGGMESIALPAALAIVLFLSHSLFESALFSVHIFPVLLFLLATISWYNERNESL